MKQENMKIEQRLQNMKNFYLKAGELIDKIPEAIPEKTRTKIKDAILGDKELKKLMEGIDSHRPPRIFLIGRTGVGKSSLINALCGGYVAGVSDTRSCTKDAEVYKCMDGDRVLMEICDTRGIAESETIDTAVTAEKALIDQINDFSPEWLPAYIDDYFQNNNDEAKEITTRILEESRELFRKLLKEKHGSNWEIMGVEPKTKTALTLKKDETDRLLIKNGGNPGNSDILTYAEYGDLDAISRYGSNWSTCFSKYYKNKAKLFEDEKNILSKLKSLHNDVTKGHNIRKKDFEDLKAFYDQFHNALNSNDNVEE